MESLALRATTTVDQYREEREKQEREAEKKRIAELNQRNQKEEMRADKRSAMSYVQRLMLGVSVKVHLANEVKQEQDRLAAEQKRLKMAQIE